MDIETKYLVYAEICREIANLEAQKEALNDTLLVNLENKVETGNKHKLPDGVFSIRKTKKYSYPEYVKKAKIIYDAEKAKSEASGEATFEENSCLVFRASK